MTDHHDDPVEIDQHGVDEFWRRCVAAGAVADDQRIPSEVFCFGDSPAMAHELAALVVDGTKRATASAVADYEHEGVLLPHVGQLAIVIDEDGVPRALIRTAEVRVGSLASVDDRFAWDEGEGDRTRASWLRDHEEFFRRHLPTIGIGFTQDLPTVFERFDVLFSE